MIAFIGDIHGNMKFLRHAHDLVLEQRPEVTTIIQVGDFGFYKKILMQLEGFVPDVPIYVIDGNYEDFSMLKDWTEVTEFSPNMFYVPRGSVLQIDDRKIAFLGGASSVDKQYRLKRGLDWHPEEVITENQAKKLFEEKDVDLFVTHTPPQSFITKYFDPNNLKMFGLPITWKDPSALLVEKAWNKMGKPKLVCGHMHEQKSAENVLVMNVNDIWCL